MQLVLGLDPGDKGGLAILTVDSDYRVVSSDVLALSSNYQFMPVNIQFLRQSLIAPVHIYCEKPFIVQGNAGMIDYIKFYGYMIGCIHAICLSNKVPCTICEFAPVVWQRTYPSLKFDIIKIKRNLAADVKKSAQTKNRSTIKSHALERARELFPSLAHKMTRKKDDGLADALLIANFGLNHLKSKKVVTDE